MSHVTTTSSPAAWPAGFSVLNHFTATAVVYWSAMLFMAWVLIAGWFDRPDRPIYGLLVAAWTFVLGPGVAIPVMLRVPPRWFRVSAGERVLHRMLGVGVFGWLLDRSGYNRRFVRPMWGFFANRAGLPRRALVARVSASAHGACFGIHLALAVLALFTGHTWGALWILWPGVVVHLYPVLLQRSIMLRLQPLLGQLAANTLAQAGFERE